MNTLHGVLQGQASEQARKISAITGMREARIMLSESSDQTGFEACLLDYDRESPQGFVLVGSNEDIEVVQRAAEVLETTSRGGLRAAVNAKEVELHGIVGKVLSPEAVFAAMASPPPQNEEPIELSAKAYRTALALMGATRGDSPSAAVHCLTLLNATGNEDFLDAVLALTDVFPWVEPTLRANDMWPFTDE